MSDFLWRPRIAEIAKGSADNWGKDTPEKLVLPEINHQSIKILNHPELVNLPTPSNYPRGLVSDKIINKNFTDLEIDRIISFIIREKINLDTVKEIFIYAPEWEIGFTIVLNNDTSILGQ